MKWIVISKLLICLSLSLSSHDAALSSVEKKSSKGFPSQCDANIAVLPPLVKDTIRGRNLVGLVISKIREVHLNKCENSIFIDELSARRAFDFFGSTNYFRIPPKKLLPRQIAFLRSELNATHILDIELKEEDNAVVVSIASLRLVDEQWSLGTFYQVLKLQLDAIDRQLDTVPPFLGLLALLTPNSFTLGSVQTKVQMDLEEGYDEISVETRGILPPIISSIGFNKIEHYRSFNLFGASGSIFPSSFLFAIDQVSTVANLARSETDVDRTSKLSVQLYGGCTTLNAQGSVHTPLGTTYLAIGFGPCVYSNRRESREPVTLGTLTTRTIFGHRSFFTERYYFFFEGDTLNFSGSPIYKNQFASSTSVDRSTVGIGLYVADVERLYTEFWTQNF